MTGVWADPAGLRRRTSVKWQLHPPDVLPAFIAEMDVVPAPVVVAAVTEAVARGDLGYAWPGALPEAFAGCMREAYGWAVDPETVRLAGGVVAAIERLLAVLTRPGDAVVVSSPAYPPFLTVPAAMGRRVVQVALGRPAPDLVALGAAFADPRARVHLLCNPHNPTGWAPSPADLVAIAELARRHDVTVVSDEIHGPLTLPGARFTPYGAVAGAVDLAGDVVVTAASKAWNVPGLTCALVAPAGPGGTTRVRDLPFDMLFGTGILGVHAATAAYSDGWDWLRTVLDAIDENHRLLGELLGHHLPGVAHVRPAATYLAWLDCRPLGLGDDPAAAFLARGRVAVSAGTDFGHGGAGHVRLNIGTAPSLVAEAVARMARVVAEGG